MLNHAFIFVKRLVWVNGWMGFMTLLHWKGLFVKKLGNVLSFLAILVEMSVEFFARP